jgi:hypothetical protein
MKTASFRLGSVHSLADLVGGVKKTVNARLSRQFRTQLPAVLIRRAVDEAEQIARETEFPHLFLPELAAEQVRRVHASLARDEFDAPYSRAA